MRTSIDSIINSPSVSTIGEKQNSIMDAALRNDSILKTRKGVGYRKRQCVDQKANIPQSNTSHRGIPSAICRLPTEILSQIFVFCLPQDQHLSPKPGLPPVLLTTICRRWREVAIGFPKLWCMLQLEADRDDWQQKALCHDTWLKRSRGCPLSLRIVCNGDLSELRNVLQPFIQQISSLTLQVDFLRCEKPFMMDDFHALKELTILKRGNGPYRANVRAIVKSLLKLPVNLHRLDLTRVLYNHRRLVPDSEWARLTDVKIRIRDMDELLRLLRLCPNISSLSMVDIKNPIKFESPGPVTHVNLQYLQVRGRFKLPSDDVGHGLFNATLSQTFASLNIAKWGRGHMKSSRHL